jgi:hypothetical protein
MEKDWQKLPVFKKALAIQELSHHLVKVIENTEWPLEKALELELLNNHLDELKKNAAMIPAKIAGVAREDTLYDLRMENASLIRKSAREILTDLKGIEMLGYKNFEYLDLLRVEIDALRVLFAEWVKTFDPWNYSIDRWGLFNPPGVDYDDHDPDDDL